MPRDPNIEFLREEMLKCPMVDSVKVELVYRVTSHYNGGKEEAQEVYDYEARLIDKIEKMPKRKQIQVDFGTKKHQWGRDIVCSHCGKSCVAPRRLGGVCQDCYEYMHGR